MPGVLLICAGCRDFDLALNQCIQNGVCRDDGGSTDSGHDGGIDGGTWCSRQPVTAHSQCYDYDLPDAAFVAANVNCQISGNPCVATYVINGAHDSPPNVAMATLPQLGLYPDYVTAHDKYEIDGNLTSAFMGFDVRAQDTYGIILDAIEWNGVGYSIAYGGYDAPVNYPNGQLIVDAAQYFDDGGMNAWRYRTNPMPDGGFIDPRVWHRFEIHLMPASDRITFTADGVQLLDDNLHGFNLVGSVLFRSGVGYIDGPFMAPTKYYFDNVYFDFTE